jgi:hypothetical protein
MSKRAGVALFVAAVALFVVLNHAAYKGYFQDDDLDTLSWAGPLPVRVFLETLVTPRLHPHNFRPVGALYYHVLGNSFGLDFPKYLVPLNVFHLLNIWLFWLLARKLGLSPLAASAGAFFFGFHAALFDAWWKPMYVFDVLCATFSLLSLLLYAYGRWILSLIAFWLAYKSKELAVMLPAVLACYELWFGQKRWKRLLPFFAVSLLFGLQALIIRPHPGTHYELRFGWAAQAAAADFYASSLFFLPYAGLALIPLPFLIRDRRLWFGFAAMCLLIFPLLALPAHLFAVYWYVPLIGAAIMLASLADSRYRVIVALLLVLWIPWDFLQFRELRRLNERREQQNRAYVTEVEKYARVHPDQRVFLFDRFPEGFELWGLTGALTCIFHRVGTVARHINDPGAQRLLDSGEAAWLHWNSIWARLDIVQYPKEQPMLPYLVMNLRTPGSQLLTGWYSLDENLRWTEPDATAVLLRPPDAKHFEIVACTPPEQIRIGPVHLRVLLDGKALGSHEFTTAGCKTLRWPAPRGQAGTVKVELHSTPLYRPPNDPRILGITVTAFGFVSE